MTDQLPQIYGQKLTREPIYLFLLSSGLIIIFHIHLLPQQILTFFLLIFVQCAQFIQCDTRFFPNLIYLWSRVGQTHLAVQFPTFHPVFHAGTIRVLTSLAKHRSRSFILSALALIHVLHDAVVPVTDTLCLSQVDLSLFGVDADGQVPTFVK